jgi:SEC-C motif
MSLSHQPDDTRAPSDPQALIERLRHLHDAMPEALHAQCLAAGTAIVPGLLAVLEDTRKDEPTAPSGPPWHAVALLGRLGDARAVPVLLRCLERCDTVDPLEEQITEALLQLGPPALEGCLEAYATTDDATRDSLACVLSRWGTHDERIYAVLLETLERSPVLGANCLVDYGDPRALGALSRCFDALPICDEGSPFSNHVFVELRGAIEDLGGTLTAAQVAKAARADAPRRRLVARLEGMLNQAAAPPPRVARASPPAMDRGTGTRKQRKGGRNAPCWCGSGKKYTHCHLDLERR